MGSAMGSLQQFCSKFKARINGAKFPGHLLNGAIQGRASASCHARDQSFNNGNKRTA